MTPNLVVPTFSRRQRVVLTVLLVLSVTTTALLVLGPGRGIRQDIGQVQTDLDASRGGIYGTLDVAERTLGQLRRQLETTQRSLEVQQQGLEVATRSGALAGRTVAATESIRQDTSEALSALRSVLTALGGIQGLRGDIATVVASVEAGVTLARTTLRLARRALHDGREALEVAYATYATLNRSERVQVALLRVARRTLEEVVEINRKIPVPPVFPSLP